ncbi:hypothetical protein B7463_g215, partial [Scytalidium lignicola]
MPVSLYEVSIPVFIRTLKNLRTFLKIGEAYADKNGIPHEKLLRARLHPTMKDLIFQVWRVSAHTVGFAIRVGGIEPPHFDDNENTFAELYVEIQKSIDFLEKVDRVAIDGKEGTDVVVKTGSGPIRWTSQDYLLKFAIPSIDFHFTTAYDLLRHNNVPLEKWDFLGHDLKDTLLDPKDYINDYRR